MQRLFGLTIYFVIINLVACTIEFRIPSLIPQFSGGIKLQAQIGSSSSSSEKKSENVDLFKPLHDIVNTIFNRRDQSSSSNSNFIDVSKLHDALNAKNVNEFTIIQILATMDAYERNKIREKYQNVYGVNLINELRDKLTGKFEEALVAYMTPLNLYYVQEIHESIHGTGADEKALIDTLCIFNNSYLETIENTYSQYYGHRIKYELSVHTINNFESLMISCLHNTRQNSPFAIDLVDDQMSHAAIIDLMSTKSFTQIRQFAIQYHKSTGKYLDAAIKNQFSDDFQRALLNIVYYADSEQLFLAKRLHESLEEKEIDHHSLIRLAVMDKTIQPTELQYFYENYYKTNLYSIITSKIPSGSYRTLIQVLLGIENTSYSY